MTQSPVLPARRSVTHTADVAGRLLASGMLAGPIYVALALLQLFLRPGYNPLRHDLSLLSNGALGWIQIGNFLLTGALVLAAACGLRLRLRGTTGGRWAPLLLALYGLGLLGAGLFLADPMNGFPPGTPDGAPVHTTLHGVLHILSGAVGFMGLVGACFVLARRFTRRRQTQWATYSVLTGIAVLAGFVGIAAGSAQQGRILEVVTLAFTVAVVLGWTWVSLICRHVAKDAERS